MWTFTDFHATYLPRFGVHKEGAGCLLKSIRKSKLEIRGVAVSNLETTIKLSVYDEGLIFYR